jgi:hypothetical protein
MVAGGKSMKDPDSALHRLLRSAAQVPEKKAAEPPFGFETRVVALWRSGNGINGGNGVLRLVRRVALAASVVIVLASAASFLELRETVAAIEPADNEFAIADSAIQNEFYR